MFSDVFTVLNLQVIAIVILLAANGSAAPIYGGDVVPDMPYDSNTTKYCTYWYNNFEGFTCEFIMNAYLVSAKDMVLWNPSLTATCGNWQERAYCVEANGMPTSTSSSTTKASTSSTMTATATSTAQPVWTLLGCFLDSTPSTLSTRTNITGGDTVMTVEKCESACYASGSTYAGLEAKSQCWCGNYVGNELTNSTECNMPCTGNSAQTCGGTGRINVYKGVLPSSTTSASSATSASTTSSRTSSSASSTATAQSVSIDGICGLSSPRNATCQGSSFGDCCSTSGECGRTTAFCAPAVCQKSYGTCNTANPISTDGRCGSASTLQATCLGSTFGQCCSVRGNCGSTLDYCGVAVGCQAAFGTCTPVSTDGKCSEASSTKASCKGSAFGQCCSVKGNCGDTAAFCAVANACQTLFGQCSPTSTDGKCGSASTTNANCIGSSFGSCCSTKGNCGSTADFCAANNLCQPNFGTCYPTSTDGKCGAASTSNASCGGSSFGNCCSTKGNCGSTAAFCAIDNLCQPAFGTCYPTSTDGKCGAASTSSASCSGSSFGNCCSTKGNCGSTSAFCGLSVGCQTAFGVCT